AMLWACIHLPALALDGVLRRHPHPDAPLALVTGPAQRRVLVAANASAARAGLRPGQALASAHALLADFAIVEYDPADVARWRDFLAAWAYRYSSQVLTCFDDAIALEVQASLRLFGPWPLFERRLRADLGELGFAHRIAVAPNPRAARVLAGMQDGLAIMHEARLQGALSRIPVARAGLEPQGAYAPPDRFDLRIELGHEVESSQALLFPLRRMLADLGTFLAGRDGGVQRFALHLEHEGHADTEVAVGLLAAERDPALLFELARSRLEQAAIPAPVRGLRLLAAELPPFVPAGRELFEQRP